MRRALLLLAFALTMAPAASGQDRVRLEVTASDAGGMANGGRRPQVRTPGILRDQRWVEILQSSFPLRLQFRVEIWRVRTDWFDALERAFEWETVVQYEPLVDQYAKSVFFGGSLRSFQRFSTLQELERDLDRVNLVSIAPAGTGDYYFTASLQIRTLTDEEVEELERFLQGQSEQDPVEQPGAVRRAARRLLLRFGGLPFEQLEARTGRFSVGGR